jgi:ABC-type multidrug transport system permease subunit
MVNKESLPLIMALFLPILLVFIILLYYYGYDITLFLRRIPWIYYVIILPIALGFTVAMIKYMKPD